MRSRVCGSTSQIRITGIVDAHQLALDVPLEHADLPLVGGPHAVERAGQEDQKPGMRDHKPSLPLLPRKANQGRTQDIHPQERQQDREPRAPVDPFLCGPAAIPRLEKRSHRPASRPACRSRSPPVSSEARKR